jgi:DNA (cytosine-5)-methyltransferase 1
VLQDPQLGEPLHTATTKDRFGLVTAEIDGEPYVITDIGMRMLTPRELFRAQGFPDSDVIDRKAVGSPISKTEQVSKCGNSVCLLRPWHRHESGHNRRSGSGHVRSTIRHGLR